MRREQTSLYAPAIGATGEVLAFGSYGRPLLAFPTEGGDAGDWERGGMVDAVGGLLDAGRVKLYCVSSYDRGSWGADVSLEEAARRNQGYADWICNTVVPFIAHDCRGSSEVMVTGCSFGACHAANFTLQRADLFPLALCLSGVYDLSVTGGGERGDKFYFNNPTDYVANLSGDHLGWLRRQANLLLVCGQGMWEDTTGALESTKHFAGLLAAKGLRHELDLWGYGIPHDWPSWRSQLAHHLPRFV